MVGAGEVEGARRVGERLADPVAGVGVADQAGRRAGRGDLRFGPGLAFGRLDQVLRAEGDAGDFAELAGRQDGRVGGDLLLAVDCG